MRKLLKPILISVICLFGAAFLVCSTLRVYDRIGRMPFYDLKYSDVAKITQIGGLNFSGEYEITEESDRLEVYTFLSRLRVGLENKNPEQFFGGCDNSRFRVELIDGSEITFGIGSGGELRSGDKRSTVNYITINGKCYNCYDWGLIHMFERFDYAFTARHEQSTQTEPIT